MEDVGWSTSNNKNSKSSRCYVSKTSMHHHKAQSILFSTNDQKLKSFIPAHKNSKLISKQLKPNKIRIIHIIPPRIIQTDKANFRSLVQRLTGRCQSSSSANTPIAKNLQTQCENRMISDHEVESKWDKIELHGFGSDRFLELGEDDFPLISQPAACNWEIELFGEF